MKSEPASVASHSGRWRSRRYMQAELPLLRLERIEPYSALVGLVRPASRKAVDASVVALTQEIIDEIEADPDLRAPRWTGR